MWELRQNNYSCYVINDFETSSAAISMFNKQFLTPWWVFMINDIADSENLWLQDFSKSILKMSAMSYWSPSRLHPGSYSFSTLYTYDFAQYTEKSNCNILPTWWRHQMETWSALLTICAGNSPVSGEFEFPNTKASNAELWCSLWSSSE